MKGSEIVPEKFPVSKLIFKIKGQAGILLLILSLNSDRSSFWNSVKLWLGIMSKQGVSFLSR